jgi:hypothetical protein
MMRWRGLITMELVRFNNSPGKLKCIYNCKELLNYDIRTRNTSLRECSRRLPATVATLAKHVKAGRLKAMSKDGRYFVELSDLLDFANRRAKGLLPQVGRPKKEKA